VSLYRRVYLQLVAGERGWGERGVGRERDGGGRLSCRQMRSSWIGCGGLRYTHIRTYIHTYRHIYTHFSHMAI